MDYGKFSAGLRRTLTSPEYAADEPLAIFIELADVPSVEQVSVLRAVGVSGAVEGYDIVTAELDREGIDILSEQPWVMSMALSDTLRLLPSSAVN